MTFATATATVIIIIEPTEGAGLAVGRGGLPKRARDERPMRVALISALLAGTTSTVQYVPGPRSRPTLLLTACRLSPRRRVAVVIHGRIGIWRTRSSHIDDAHVVWLANAPQAWRSAPKSMDGIDTNVSAHSTLAGFAAFGRGSLWQYVISPNREAGLSLDIFLHSWHAEIGALLDAMYAPTASRHEPVQRRLNTVQSQHLSMKTALGLMTKHEATTRQPYDLALVTRYDILYFTQLMLAPLGEAPLWLPHWCHRYPLTAQAGMLIRAACGNWPGHGEGYLVHPATTTGVDPTSRLRRSLKSREADFDFAYLDWWFVATPAIART